ncbi:bifunctional 4-hydroxy-2-oxoglutarate aldolase/2-dehydro-3-deoxy-phosphogluconate aldolase [uncultured Algibacter sp.]|uniref:bifunctional 4-hydroxy-2-oxoglutarate aldolase/2-dehydro-3-deoxy-phosphogluconate aldolase n=1 Tax=uncultured Algibacter sp. TaxID=298659 RepID=UPI002625FC57|nr:bifunctional 4-hydroxy-2-oxoglutarate aldolase/2-dehydro-3-deoxy-phosphogluconate aldolase [uncultured Algibacter sp.]
MNREELVKVIGEEKLVFVTRLKDASKAQTVIQSLVSGGAKVMEITSNTPNYAHEISKARKSYPDVLIGAGTVVNKAIAAEAINAGAQFLVTPNCNVELIDLAHKNEIPILMGALTPTEICEAWEAGADFVKLFPADIMGITYFTSIKAPLDHIKLMAVGGIKLNEVKDWMTSGADGIGIASVVSEPISIKADYQMIEDNASQFVTEIAKYK